MQKTKNKKKVMHKLPKVNKENGIKIPKEEMDKINRVLRKWSKYTLELEKKCEEQRQTILELLSWLTILRR